MNRVRRLGLHQKTRRKCVASAALASEPHGLRVTSTSGVSVSAPGEKTGGAGIGWPCFTFLVDWNICSLFAVHLKAILELRLLMDETKSTTLTVRILPEVNERLRAAAGRIARAWLT